MNPLEKLRRPVECDRIFLLGWAVLCAAQASGCGNIYSSPQAISPLQELNRSEKKIVMGGAMLSVPYGWVADTVRRYDDEDRPLLISLVKLDARGRIAIIWFEATDSAPIWPGNANIHETSTKSHQHVIYETHVRQEPTGDDAPGKFNVNAYVKSGETFWCMSATFFTPVEPELREAVNYIDCIVAD